MGVTKASFQVVGKDEELNDLLNKMDSGILSCCAHSLSDNIGHPSGPEALEGSRLINFVYTAHALLKQRCVFHTILVCNSSLHRAHHFLVCYAPNKV